MKATHKLEGLTTDSAWDLADTASGLYYKMTSPRKSVEWHKSFYGLDHYLGRDDFSCTRLNKFKGNK